jgi:hypothetical protein
VWGVHLGLVAIQPCHRVAQAAQKGGHRSRPAQPCQQQVGGGVVTGGQRCSAQGGNGHAAFGQQPFGDRRPGLQIGPAVGQLLVEPQRACSSLVQRRAGQQQLETAAHREAFVAAVAPAPAAAGVPDLHTQLAAAAPLDACKRVRQLGVGRRLGGGGRLAQVP